MMTLANYGIGSGKQKDRNQEKILSKSLQIRNKAELSLKQHLKNHHRLLEEKGIEIQNTIKDYYSRIPFDAVIWNKYQTKQCIIDSILLLDTKFNPYRAKDAFRLVEEMLINLVYLPWHPEFRTIHLYSGLFRSSISEQLVNIEEVLRAAGYEFCTNNPMHLVLPEDKMPQVDDGESVTGVIFDCMLAQVICADIINVFESCAKAAKLTIDGGQTDIEIDYSWIQAYLTERSHQVTERACYCLQELLRELSIHLSKVSSNKVQQTEDKIPRSKLETYERTRDSLLQRIQKDDSKMATLLNDLLRIPAGSGEAPKKPNVAHRVQDNNSDLDSNASSRHKINPTYLVHDQQQSNNVSSNSHQYQKRSVPDRQTLRLVDSLDSAHGYSQQNGTSFPNRAKVAADMDSLQAEIIESQQGDREPLLPRYERKAGSHYNTNQFKKASIYDSNYDNDYPVMSNGSNHHPKSMARHHYEDPSPLFLNDNSSQSQLNSTNQTRGPTSKYSTPSYRKYTDMRQEPEKLLNSKSQWSCGSCTYNNQISSEICEMCHNRKR